MRTPPSSPSREPVGTLISIQAGRVRKLGTPEAANPLHRPWRSAFFKDPIRGIVYIGILGVVGDEQADRKHHGGPDQALLMYSADHFQEWVSLFGLAGLAGGGFGENLTVSGFAEPDVCIGDRLCVGSTLLEVTQPRQPCTNINRRWGRKGITEAVTASGRGGWYLRVIEPGSVSPGDEVVLVNRPHPDLTIAAACDALYRRNRSRQLLEALVGAREMPEGFRQRLRVRLNEPPE